MSARITDPKAVFYASEPKYLFARPEAKPGDAKYIEITAVQVDEAYLAEHGNRVITTEQPQGQVIEVSDWVLTRADGTQWTMWDQTNPKTDSGLGAKFQDRWKPVDGKPGFFSARAVKNAAVELPNGGQLKVSWGDVQGGPGSFLLQYGEEDYNIITPADLLKNKYEGADDLSTAKVAAVQAMLDNQ